MRNNRTKFDCRRVFQLSCSRTTKKCAQLLLLLPLSLIWWWWCCSRSCPSRCRCCRWSGLLFWFSGFLLLLWLLVVGCWLFPPTGCSRAHTLLNVHFVLFFTVFSASVQCCPRGGEGGAGTTDVYNWWYRGGMSTFHVTCSRCWCYATLGWGGMLTFHVTCSRCWCYATLGWGGDVSVPCNLLTLLMLRHAGVGGDANVPCNLLTLLMLRHAGVGGMLTFHVTCSRCWCYATLGWGGC